MNCSTRYRYRYTVGPIDVLHAEKKAFRLGSNGYFFEVTVIEERIGLLHAGWLAGCLAAGL